MAFFLKKSGIILAFFDFMREFLVALNARFTSTIEKGLIKGTRSTISGNMGTEEK